MKVGIIAVGRDCADVMDQVLAPWLEVMDETPDSFHLCLISATFKEMEKLGLSAEPDQATADKMESIALARPKDTSSSVFMHYATEAQVRERGRQILMAGDIKADLIWLLDLSDEYYAVTQIKEALAYMVANPFIVWARLPFRNYVFTRDTYLVDPFTPPRIWRARAGRFTLSECNYDNDFLYQQDRDSQGSLPTAERDRNFASVTIPLSTPIRHETWLNSPRSQLKVRYQSLHFAHHAGCSFAWDDSRGGLIWNDDYFRRTGQPIPETARD